MIYIDYNGSVSKLSSEAPFQGITFQGDLNVSYQKLVDTFGKPMNSHPILILMPSSARLSAAKNQKKIARRDTSAPIP